MTDTNTQETQKVAPQSFRIILGRKIGMTQLFDDKGCLMGVTVVKAGPCAITRVRTAEKDGYLAVCLGYDQAEKEKLSKPLLGQFEKSGLAPMKHLKEFRLSDIKGFEVGQIVSIKDRFKVGDYIDVQGVNKGHGFAGGMKRHNFHGLPASHGASDKERSPGSLASRRSLGRVLPGQRMAGRMGQETITIAKLEIVKADYENNFLFLNGSVPGTNGSLISVLETTRPQKRRIVHAPKVADKKAKAAKPTAAKPAAAKK
ncbi:MAG: 50S ribosomal protein L3 [Elusimicrobia bacterium]|nr:50S ribosomal protein L3 [Elusimicrobiota bacterium]